MKKAIMMISLYILLILFIGSCEPKDWEYILAAPGPVINFSLTHTGGESTININFTYPSSSVNQYQNDGDYLVAWLYYKPVNSGTEKFITHFSCELDVPVGDNLDLGTSSLTTGEEYAFIIYTIDSEYQRSEPAIQTTIW
ncbi:MAG: hypothetical protein JXR70_12940 [Spirochaetales bacterium]|nr:hypothetical protein [Spirochaetales bacterium]